MIQVSVRIDSDHGYLLYVLRKGNAKVANLEEDLDLRPGIYNTALSIFFVGYVIGKSEMGTAKSIKCNLRLS